MKFSCYKSVLLDGINTAQRAVSSKSIQPITQGILIETSGETVKFSATDIEIGIQKELSATVEEEGATVVPARLFREIASKLPNDMITCELRNGTLKVYYDESVIEIQTANPEEFPLFPELKAEAVVIPTEVIRDGLKKVLIAINLNSKQTTLTGVLVTLAKGVLELTSTDAKRVAIYTHPVESGMSFEGIIPGKTAIEILRLLEGDEVKVILGWSQLIFQFGSTTIYTRMLDGEFPKFKQIIPKQHEAQIEVDVEKLVGTIERASALADGENRIIRIEGNETLSVRALATGSGKIDEKVYVKHSGKDIGITLKSNFLSDVLKVLEKKTCVISLSGANAPFVIREDHYLYLAVPIRS